jgi:predicted flap endonuclease-1-like 5' DNA nuclease
MPAELTANWPLILIGLVLLLVAAWLLIGMRRRAKVIADDDGAPLARDVLAEGAAPAARNQALIDAAPAAVTVVPVMVPAEAAPAAQPEPVSAPEPAPAPVPAVVPAAIPAATTTGDDLSRIKGIGPKLVALLGELGVTTFAQIAAWDDAAIERIDAQLGRFAGRITRDQWVQQAKLLAAGDEASFAGKFGNNG